MADYTDPGLAIKKLAANVKAKMAQKADASALAAKIDKPTGTGLKVWDATTDTWEPAPTGGTSVTDPRVASWVTDGISQTRTALNANFAQRVVTRPASDTGFYMVVTDESAGYGTIRLKDTPANGGSQLDLQHYGNGSSAAQTYAINIANQVDAGKAFVIHQYSNRAPAVQIDNTGMQAAIVLKNTENQTMNPGGTGTGAFLQMLPYPAANGGLTFTNSLTVLNNNKDYDLKVQAVASKSFAFQVRQDTDKTGLHVVKYGAGAGSVVEIDNRGTGACVIVKSGGTEIAALTATGEIELKSPGKGVVLTSPGGARYRLTVTDGGALAIAPA